MRSSVTSVRNISLFLKNLKQRSVYYWRYRFRPHARDWARRVPRGVRSRLREARLAHPGAFWAAVFGIIPVAIVVAIFISGTAAGVWAAYHSNREDIAPLGTFVTAIGVIIAAAIALMRHFAQTEADRQRRIVESFSKAVEQLGSDKLELRVGAIFALERLSRESPDDYWTIMEVLTAFVRERMRYTTIMARLSERAYFLWMQAGRPKSRSEEFWVEAVRLERLDQTPTDVAAILTVIKRRSVENQRREEDRGWRFDLQGTYLRKANLTEFVLKAANLKAAHFEEADLSDAHLEGATLEGAHLEGAILADTHLKEEADLRGAHLEGANLEYAYLERADLSDAHLEGANLGLAHLEWAWLKDAHLEGADLEQAHLENATLTNAHLERAHLMLTVLKRARLDGAHLEGADFSVPDRLPEDLLQKAKTVGLTDDQLLKAFGDGETKLPEGITRPKHWPPLQKQEG
jgi:hypothetical protein